jgi:hypothetical protein
MLSGRETLVGRARAEPGVECGDGGGQILWLGRKDPWRGGDLNMEGEALTF